MINKVFIYDYMKKIDKQSIINYALREGINLDNKEIDIIYFYIRNRYIDIINNTEDILLEIKDELNNKTYQKILELYDKYIDIIKKIR